MLALLSLLACEPPKIELDTGVDDRTLDETTDDTSASGSDEGGDDGGDDTATSGGGDDTATSGGGDDTGAGGDDTATGGGDDTGTTETTEPDPEPDYSVWLGTREITIEDCTETLTEEGVLLESDWEYYGDAQSACESCTHFYYVVVSPDEICGGYPVTTELYRGLKMTTDSSAVDIYNLDSILGWIYAETLAEGAPFDGWSFDYGYDDYWGYILYEGRVEFPEL